MSLADRASKRMKGDGGPMGAGPPEGYYGQHAPSGRYPPYAGAPPSGYSMWQGGHPPPHSWGHGSSGPPPPHGSMYQQRGGMPQDRGGYGGAYPPRGHPPPHMSGPGGVRRDGKPAGPPPSSRPISKEGGPSGPPPSESSVPPHQSGYQRGYYPPHQAPYGNSPYSNGPPPPMHHAPPPQSYGSPPPPQSNSNCNSLNGGTPARQSQSRPQRMNSEQIVVGTSTGTDAPDFDNLFSPRGASGDDDGTSSVGTGGGVNSKDKGRGSYKCGRCGVPKKGHVCPYQPKVTRKIGEPLPEMRSAAIQVEMDEFMTLRRLNLRIQGFPESYASEPHGEDMVVGEPHQHPSMSPLAQQQEHGDMMNGTDNGPPPTLPPSGHDPIASALPEDPLVGAA